MKNLILLELCFIFLATSFPGNAPPPPGWFPQVRPVDKVIRDIFFIDSLNGWSVTDGAANPNDTGYIFNTTNAGTNWTIQYKDRISFSAIQFLDKNLGYAIGGSPPNGVMLKTLNGGLNWFTVALINPDNVDDIFFINNDTGWYCSGFLFDGGIYRTINGGVNWQLQRGGLTGTCQLFFLNNDTGWATYGSSSSGSLYRTTNSGLNWNLQYSFPSGLGDVYFFNANNGVVTSGRTYTTTNGGFNWTISNSTATGGKMSFVDDSVGWAGNGPSIIAKTFDKGQNWFYQNSPILNNFNISAFDSLKAWAGGSGIVHTTDGGGLSSIIQIGTELPTDYILYQNYPNPFNPTTKIRFSVKGNNVNVKITIYDVSGKLISEIINQNFTSGTYETDFNSNNLTSGVYFYSLNINDKIIDTKKMIILK